MTLLVYARKKRCDMHLSVHRGSEFLKKIKIQPPPPPFLASFPGSLLKTGGRREPGNIHGKGCELPAPDSGGTNDCIMKLRIYTCDALPTQQNIVNSLLHLEGSRKPFLDVRKGHKSKIEVHCSWFAVLTRSAYFAAVSLHV